MYPIPPSEHLIETKTCRHCNTSFPITNNDMEFYEKVSPVFTGKKYLIPTPTLCPDCRQQRRLSFRNERKLYKRKCDATGKDIVSMYSPDKPFKVYHQDYWWSDAWDPMDYGRNFDFGRGFFEQFGEIDRTIPKFGLIQRNSINSDYANDVERSKNCYLCFTSWENEDSMYVSNIFWSKNCIDGFWFSECERCYESINLNKCYDVSNSIACFDCSGSSYLIGCKWCKDCLFSIGQNNKEYYFLNKQIDKEEFLGNKTRIRTDKEFLRDCLERFNTLKRETPYVSINQSGCENCEWDFLSESSNSSSVFDCHYVEDCKYIFQWGPLYDAMDISITGSNDRCGLVYEWLSAAWTNKSIWTITVWNSRDILYSNNCYDSHNLFACIGLRNKSYCIFNKQYTKDEYEELVPKIIEHMMKTGEWWEFFPSSLSPFGYNETVAQEYYPLDHTDVPRHISADGKPIFNWSDYEPPFPKVEKIIPAAKLPDDITKIPDDILNWAIECEVTRKPFRIIKQELEFYRKHNLPIPRRHPDVRHADRMALRNPRKLFERKCDKCQKDMITTYAPCEMKWSLEVPLGCSPEKPEKVYCEECYNREVIG